MQAYMVFTPATIVLDIVMPGMDEIELVAWLGSLRSSARLIIVTGYAPDYAANAKILAEYKGTRAGDDICTNQSRSADCAPPCNRKNPCRLGSKSKARERCREVAWADAWLCSFSLRPVPFLLPASLPGADADRDGGSGSRCRTRLLPGICDRGRRPSRRFEHRPDGRGGEARRTERDVSRVRRLGRPHRGARTRRRRRRSLGLHHRSARKPHAVHSPARNLAFVSVRPTRYRRHSRLGRSRRPQGGRDCRGRIRRAFSANGRRARAQCPMPGCRTRCSTCCRTGSMRSSRSKARSGR